MVWSWLRRNLLAVGCFCSSKVIPESGIRKCPRHLPRVPKSVPAVQVHLPILGKVLMARNLG
jgi:hypothetical protein